MVGEWVVDMGEMATSDEGADCAHDVLSFSLMGLFGSESAPFSPPLFPWLLMG